MFASAVDDEVIAVNPCTRRSLPKVRKSKVEPMPRRCECWRWPGDAAAVPCRGRARRRAACARARRSTRAPPEQTSCRRRLLVRQQVQHGQLAPLKSEKSERACRR